MVLTAGARPAHDQRGETPASVPRVADEKISKPLVRAPKAPELAAFVVSEPDAVVTTPQRGERDMPMVKEPLRNELMIRLDDRLLAWLDGQRGQEYRSTYIRRVLEREAQRELPKDGERSD